MTEEEMEKMFPAEQYSQYHNASMAQQENMYNQGMNSGYMGQAQNGQYQNNASQMRYSMGMRNACIQPSSYTPLPSKLPNETDHRIPLQADGTLRRYIKMEWMIWKQLIQHLWSKIP